MKIAVSDSSPLHYLILIGEERLLPSLFGRIIIPSGVQSELSTPRAPIAVKTFLASPPAWLEVRAITIPFDDVLAQLDQGEQESITLAREIMADVLLIDEVKGRTAATHFGLRTIGTLRILYDAAVRGLCDLEGAYSLLTRISH